MREIELRLRKGNEIQGYINFAKHKIIDPAYEWDYADQYTGLRDKTGSKIFESDRLRFFPCEATKASNDGCIWDGTVIFEDGVYTVDILTIEQVANPKNWDQTHDWIRSRWWSTTVGYGEMGSWNCPRTDLVSISNGFGSREEDYQKLYKPLAEKIGYGNRFINAKVIGNFENLELLENKK